MSAVPVIPLLSGSLRAGSTNESVLRSAQVAAPSVNVRAVVHDLAELPHFNPDDDTDSLPAAVAELRAAIARRPGS